MRIERVELRQIRLPLLFPFETSFGVTRERSIILLRVIDSDGGEGWGECVADNEPLYSEEWTGSAWPVLEQFLAPILLANPFQSAAEVDGLFENIKGNRMAKAAIETACWDLDARRRNLPLWTLLGGTRSEIPCGVSIGLQRSTDVLLQKIERELAAGYQRIKIKIKPGHDLELVDAVRDRFPDIKLMVDANSAYRLKDAPLLRDLDRYQLMMIEQPLAHDDIAEHARLQKEIATPICLDESIRSAADARHALELGACRIINIKLGRVGGHSESRRIEQVCREQNIPVWCGGMLEAGIGRAHNIALSTLAGFTLPGDVSASSRYWEEDIIDPPVTVTDRGTIVPPSGPGIGFTVRLDRIEKLATRKLVLPSPSASPGRGHEKPGAGAGSGVVIRDLKAMAEFQAVEQLQKEIWSVEDREILPAIHMIAATAVGAILVGAFDRDELIGFVYGFPGFEGDKRIIHSDMLAVRNEHRDHGLGRKLKLAQRERALAQGIDRITWTFDPLRAKNAHLNLAQLSVVAHRYLRNFYGETTSPLHSLGTDRLWVTWHLTGATTSVAGKPLHIEIPNDIAALAPVEALNWRDRTRREFEEAFASGYVATGFERGDKTSRYILMVQSQSRP